MGGGIYNYGAIIHLLNTIIAGNGAQASSSDVSGIVFSSGYNLIGDASGALGFQSTDLQNVLVHLAPLQDNGGPTWTCALQSTSPAIGRATNFGAPATDQRGVPRPVTHVDIGAYQMGNVPLPLPIIDLGPASQTANYGDSVTFTVSASPAPVNYQWRRNGVNLPGQIQSTLVLPRVAFTDAATYDVVVFNSSGSVISAGAVLIVQIPPGAPTIGTQPQNVDIRASESATLSVQATSPGGALSYQWYVGQTGDVTHPVAGATSANCTLPGLSATTSFWVSVRNSVGTVDSHAATVTVFSAVAPKLRLQTLAGQPGIIIDGQVGTNCRIEFSADPARNGWTKLIDFSLPTAPFTYIDATGTSARLRFYRVVVP